MVDRAETVTRDKTVTVTEAVTKRCVSLNRNARIICALPYYVLRTILLRKTGDIMSAATTALLNKL